MVGASPEIAYNEAQKKLKQHFGRSAIVATDFKNKLANWPKIANNDAQGLRNFSDFLQQVDIAKTHLSSLQILTKWFSKVQTLQQEKGCDAFPTFTEFVAEVTLHADCMNIPQIYQNSPKVLRPTFSGRSSPPDPPHCRKPPYSTTMASKTGGESKPLQPDSKQPESLGPKPSVQESSTANKLCLFHQTKTHTLSECNKVRELTFDERKDFFKKKKLCFKSMSVKHNTKNCHQAPPECRICHKRHLTALHIKPALQCQNIPEANRTSTACTQVCGEEEPEGHVQESSWLTHLTSLTQLKN